MKAVRKSLYYPPYLTRHELRRALTAKATGECALLLGVCESFGIGTDLTISRSGTNVVISWPVSATNHVLQSGTNLAAQWNWTAVAVDRVAHGQWLSVTIPVGDSHRFFRLKDVISEKDPGEKDPATDKDPNEKQPENKDPMEKYTEGGGKDAIADKEPNEKDEEGQDINVRINEADFR